jgi:hypothetical protein
MHTCEAETAAYKVVTFLLNFTSIIIKNAKDNQ